MLSPIEVAIEDIQKKTAEVRGDFIPDLGLKEYDFYSLFICHYFSCPGGSSDVAGTAGCENVTNGSSGLHRNYG